MSEVLPGIHTIPAAEYFALPRASNSGLKLIARSPAHYAASLLTPVEPTPAMVFGTAVHTAVQQSTSGTLL